MSTSLRAGSELELPVRLELNSIPLLAAHSSTSDQYHLSPESYQLENLMAQEKYDWPRFAV